VNGIPIHVAPALLLIVVPGVPLGGSGAGTGFGTVQFPIPDDPSLSGASLFTQWLVMDPAAPGGLSATRGARQRLF
jgi:hypothetical protein